MWQGHSWRQIRVKVGYPTANLQVSDKDKLIPREGVYAVRTDIDGALFEGMMYIGKRPTVSQQDFMNIEVNLFDFNDNFYNKNIRIEILKFYQKVTSSLTLRRFKK